ncbi:hypothetical protein RHSIM_Rhsim04G0073300 [Rhododendron simsii]|uniref:Uncharacterized protein n=1 Tax=Rhododendron simsii TaxID=118357 RepID=A0A834H0R0_RHOSS|nr:hypothetical protein RHSIM_Rhsim04G0073300 [Rhododendron simsii]
MAESTAANASLLLLLLFLAITSAAFISTSESRIIHTPQKNLKRSDRVLILRDLGLDPSVYYRQRSLDANTERNAPGGPDPQHHGQPPF